MQHQLTDTTLKEQPMKTEPTKQNVLVIEKIFQRNHKQNDWENIVFDP